MLQRQAEHIGLSLGEGYYEELTTMTNPSANCLTHAWLARWLIRQIIHLREGGRVEALLLAVMLFASGTTGYVCDVSAKADDGIMVGVGRKRPTTLRELFEQALALEAAACDWENRWSGYCTGLVQEDELPQEGEH
ncbi:hypothetical protein scyTo_0011024 [Scyliorhinus torazame]|uniref:Uncharacterized protein n=1 Tax=Scyliorhinus torazame TaxID=75743 RepID=A0A401NG71_SCYTO|nr:hypothetical protein [Scyliorhinus torazame]